MKGRSSRKLQIEFPDLKKRYWGRHFWVIGFGCWSTGNITDEMVNQYQNTTEIRMKIIMITS
jgi:putative transposase